MHSAYKNTCLTFESFCQMRIIACGAREIVAAHSLHRLTRQRPATTTNRDSRPSVGVATGARSARFGVTGSARADRLHPSLALGLDRFTNRQMEKVACLVTLPQLCRINVLHDEEEEA